MYVHMSVCKSTYVCKYVFVSLHTYVHMSVCKSTSVCMYVCMCVCKSTYVCMYINYKICSTSVHVNMHYDTVCSSIAKEDSTNMHQSQLCNLRWVKKFEGLSWMLLINYTNFLSIPTI